MVTTPYRHTPACQCGRCPSLLPQAAHASRSTARWALDGIVAGFALVGLVDVARIIL